jgi:uncharacterized membrane protein YeaQ/YmgE (transglycosylase-associated protein family)
MHVILFLVFGLVVGAIARMIVPGKDAGGWVVSMVLGVAGAMLGGSLGQVVGLYRQGEPAGFLMSLVGAILLVGAYHAITGGRRTAI